MPVYDYACEACGPFTVMRPMAEFQHPHDCPDCGAACRRAFLTAPRLSGLDPAKRTAHATNERSRHAPRRSGGHGAGCGCCAPRKAASPPAAANSLPAKSLPAKSFPNARPWMISH